MNITRRGFLQGFAALAATAVVSPSVLVPLARTDEQRLLDMAKTGVIEGQTFLFDGPVVIAGIANLFIVRSNFIWKTDRVWGGSALEFKNCGLHVHKCSFEANFPYWSNSDEKAAFDVLLKVGGGPGMVLDTVSFIRSPG